MELTHPLVRVPFEKANKAFRLYHKQVTREVACVGKSIEELYGKQQPGQRVDVDDMIEKLSVIAQKIKQLKQDAALHVQQQQADLAICVKRVEHVQQLEARDTREATSSGGAKKQHTKEDKDHLVRDRLIAEYLLSRGYKESSKIIQETRGVEYLVDDELHTECRSILADLQAHNTSTAIKWCSHNGSRLRRLQSPLEFYLRLQEYIELVRSNKKMEAIAYAQSFLPPLALQLEDEEAKQHAIEEMQEAMATLAYASPADIVVESHAKLFASDRWQGLMDTFQKAFFDVYGIPDPSSLCIALHAGLSTLNTRACHRIRSCIASTVVNKSAGKERKRSNDSDEEDVAVDRDAVWYKQSNASSSSQRSKKSKLAASEQDIPSGSSTKSKSKRSKYSLTNEPPVPICPTCSEVGSQLCTSLPFACHPLSRLVCRVTHHVMDEHNPPFVLPNGYVYSKQAIDQLTQHDAKKGQDVIQCVETQAVFPTSDVKPVYIL